MSNSSESKKVQKSKADLIRYYVRRYNEDDHETYHQDISNADVADWMIEQVPFFECSDKLLEDIYYFRWWVFRKHIKTTPEGRIITEFLPEVPWAGAFNSINCAAGHHIAEARWLKDGPELVNSYVNFWFRGSGDVYSYSSWIIDAIYRYGLVTGDKALGRSLVKELNQYYEHIEASNMTEAGLFWSDDDRDAMEMSISGSGLRPTLNSYMFGNAQALSQIAQWASDESLADEMSKKAEHLRTAINTKLWDQSTSFYKAIPQDSPKNGSREVSLDETPLNNNVREAIGYIPWFFDIPPLENAKSWNALKNASAFRGKAGPTTAERNHPSFNRANPGHECLWNGPSWPFATTQILDSMISARRRELPEVSGSFFYEELSRYAAIHFRKDDDGKRIHWLDENLDADTGLWLSRDILQSWGWPEIKGGVERGKDYNHSAFCDLIIRGVCGIDADSSDTALSVKPLIPVTQFSYFRLQDLTVRGREIEVAYDRDGSHFGKNSGLMVSVDGEPQQPTSDKTSIVLEY